MYTDKVDIAQSAALDRVTRLTLRMPAYITAIYQPRILFRSTRHTDFPVDLGCLLHGLVSVGGLMEQFGLAWPWRMMLLSEAFVQLEVGFATKGRVFQHS